MKMFIPIKYENKHGIEKEIDSQNIENQSMIQLIEYVAHHDQLRKHSAMSYFVHINIFPMKKY
jgi:hypothetical protein